MVDNLRALEFLKSILPENATENPASTKEALLPSSMPTAMAMHAEAAVDSFVSGRPLNQSEAFAMEAIVIPDKRPAVLIQDGDYAIPNKDWRHLNADTVRAVLKPAIAAVCRIEIPGHPRSPYAGTGFIVGDGLLMTNRHVASLFSSGIGRNGIMLMPEMRPGVDFRKEQDRNERETYGVAGVTMVHPYWDMALVKLTGLSKGHASLSLSLRSPEELLAAGGDVVVVGYPANDPERNPPAVISQVFADVFQVKRLQPGKIGGTGAYARSARNHFESFGKDVPAMLHNASTLGGNSGSGVIDPGTGEALGLHFAGRYLEFNCAVPGFDLASDPRVVDAGVRFAGTPRPKAGAYEAWWNSVERPAQGRGVHFGDAGVQASRGGGDDDSKVGEAKGAAGDGVVRLNVPLEITVRLGEPSLGVAAPKAQLQPQDEATERLLAPIHDEDYTNRSGYDANFLGVAAPLPVPTDLSVVSAVDGGHLLHYEHFSIAMHKVRRLALFVAANIDASPAAKNPPGMVEGRRALGGLGDNDQELWFIDPRIPALHQLPDKFFTKDRKSFDKGHLVRREDVAWGKTFAELQRANGDSFHVTNCSPQVAGFNRAKGTNWGALEKLVDDFSARGHVSVLAGPVLAEGDGLFHGFDDAGRIAVPIPTSFWKVVLTAEGGRLRAFGFLLDQDLRDVRFDEAIPDKWLPAMVPLGDIEVRAGLLRFPQALHQADQFASEHGEAARRIVGAVAKRSRSTGAGRRRTAGELAEGPQTFRDPLLSVFQSAAAAIADRQDRTTSGASATEGMAIDNNAILDAEEACIAALEGRGLSLPGEEEALDLGARAALCAKLGLQLFKAQLIGNKAAAEEISQQMMAGTCDPGWADTLRQYAKAYGIFADPAKRRYVRPKAAGDGVITIPAKARIAVFGDWGTGAAPARRLLTHVAAGKPDIVLHLGDIYYSGTREECDKNFEQIVDTVLQRGEAKFPPVYTLCGNHDMYSGGDGYYGLIKRLNADANQQKASFFCLRAENKSWQILGMDTGRNDYSPYSVANAVTFIEPEEEAWLERRVSEFKGKTILASHHPMFSCFGACGPKNGQGRDSAINPNLKRLYDRLIRTGRQIPIWLWGHEHNLGIYERYAGLPAGRCIGHGAVPVFSADEPYEIPAGLDDPPFLKPGTHIADLGQYAAHGFAMLALAGEELRIDYVQDRNGVAETHFSEVLR